MTIPRPDARRPPPRPAGSLYRVAAVTSFLTLPLLWVAYLVLPQPGPVSCQDHVCPPSTDVVRRSLEPPELVLAVAGAELAVIGCYLALAAARRTLDLRTGLRWSPAAVAIVALAVGGFGWLMDGGSGLSIDGVEFAFLVLLLLWLLTPLVLYSVHRGDRRAVLPVAVGLAPTAVGNALVVPEDPFTPLPAIMLVAGVITILVVRRRTGAPAGQSRRSTGSDSSARTPNTHS